MLKATPVFYYSIHKHLSVQGEDNHPGLIVGEPFIRLLCRLDCLTLDLVDYYKYQLK